MICYQKMEVQLQMHFIEAHRIVHSFAGAIGNSKIGFYTSEMVQGRSDQELYDAFTIFFGHMVIWRTRTREECDKYLMLLHWVPNRISEDDFASFKASSTIVERAKRDKLYAITHKRQVKEAEAIELKAAELLVQMYEVYNQRVQQFDYGDYLQNLVKLVQDRSNHCKEQEFEFFMDDYIQFVYSNTSLRVPNDEDYASFWSFDFMRKLLAQPNNLAPIARRIFIENKEYILSSK